MWKCRLCWASGDETLDLTGRWIIEWFLFWIKRYIQLFIWTQNHTTHTEVECRLCRCGVDGGAGGIMVLTLVTSCKHILNIVWPPTSRPVIASYLTGVAAASAPAHLAPDCSTTHSPLLRLRSSPDHNYRVLQNIWSTLEAFMWLIFKSFLLVFLLFWLSIIGDFSLWYCWGIGMKN